MCQSCFLWLIEFHGGSAEKVVAWEMVKGFGYWRWSFWLSLMTLATFLGRYHVENPSLHNLNSLRKEIGFVGFVEFRIGSISCNEPLSSRSSDLLWGWSWWGCHIDMNCAFQVWRIDLTYHLKSLSLSLSLALSPLIHIPISSSSSSAGAVRVVVIPWSKCTSCNFSPLLDDL